VTLLSEVIH